MSILEAICKECRAFEDRLEYRCKSCWFKANETQLGSLKLSEKRKEDLRLDLGLGAHYKQPPELYYKIKRRSSAKVNY